MSKTTATYWNPLKSDNDSKWECIDGSEGLIEQLTLAQDEKSGDYTRLTRFKPSADTAAFGSNSHEYPEEIFIVSGRLYDAAFDRWLEQGESASRPPGEMHGPFKTDTECICIRNVIPFSGQKIIFSSDTNGLLSHQDKIMRIFL